MQRKLNLQQGIVKIKIKNKRTNLRSWEEQNYEKINLSPQPPTIKNLSKQQWIPQINLRSPSPKIIDRKRTKKQPLTKTKISR